MKTALLPLAVLASLAFSPLAHAGDYLNKDKPTAESYPISEAVKVGRLVYLSGKLGTLPGTPKLAEGGIEGEAKQAMENIKSLLESHHWSMENLVKCTIFLADSKELPKFNGVYKTYFPNLHYPARSAVGVSGLALDARVEVECIADVGK